MTDLEVRQAVSELQLIRMEMETQVKRLKNKCEVAELDRVKQI